MRRGSNKMIPNFFNYFLDENSITTVIASITCILVVCLVVSLIGLKTIGMKRANSFPDIGTSGMFELEICPTILQGHTFSSSERTCDIIHGTPYPDFNTCIEGGYIPWAIETGKYILINV